MTQPEPEYRTIKLTNGKVTIVDAADFDWLAQWKWNAHKTKIPGKYYAHRTVRDENGQRTLPMHRLIVGDPKGVHIDHFDGDSLNNRRLNLRKSTQQQNNCNRRTNGKNNTSGFKGVSWHKGVQKWSANICCNKKPRWLGLFASAEEAARAYNVAAVELFGEFARLNELD